MVAVVVVVAAVAGPGALPQPDHRLEATERVHVIHVEVPRPGLLATGVVLPADGEGHGWVIGNVQIWTKHSTTGKVSR